DALPIFSDFQRPLANRGRRAAPLMGREMARRGWLPDLALISSSVRTRQTWELVSAQWKNPCASIFTETIYEADPADILAEIRKIHPETHRLVVIGHNPGLQILAKELAGPQSDPASLSLLAEKFPTSALARFTTDKAWKTLDRLSTNLTHFLRPRDFG